MGMFRCRGLSRKMSMGGWSLPIDSPPLKRKYRDFKLGATKAISKMFVVPWHASKGVCSALFRYVSFSYFTIPLRLCRYQFHPEPSNLGQTPGTRLEGSKTPPPGQSLCTKSLSSGQNKESEAPPPGHKFKKFHECIYKL